MSNGKCNKPWLLSLRMKGGSREGKKWGRERERRGSIGEKEAVRVTLLQPQRREEKSKMSAKTWPQNMASGESDGRANLQAKHFPDLWSARDKPLDITNQTSAAPLLLTLSGSVHTSPARTRMPVILHLVHCTEGWVAGRALSFSSRDFLRQTVQSLFEQKSKKQHLRYPLMFLKGGEIKDLSVAIFFLWGFMKRPVERQRHFNARL